MGFYLNKVIFEYTQFQLNLIAIDMSNFSDAEIADFRDIFSLFDRSGKNEILYQDVAECLRSFGYRPTNAEIAKLLNQPSKEDMRKKFISFNEFLPMLAQVAGE